MAEQNGKIQNGITLYNTIAQTDRGGWWAELESRDNAVKVTVLQKERLILTVGNVIGAVIPLLSAQVRFQLGPAVPESREQPQKKSKRQQ